jgi:hypothetical protein
LRGGVVFLLGVLRIFSVFRVVIRGEFVVACVVDVVLKQLLIQA